MRQGENISEIKTGILLRYIKEYDIRNPITLGLVFCIFNEMEVMENAVFLNNIGQIHQEPLLVIGYDEIDAPTGFTYQGLEYRDSHEIFRTLLYFSTYYVYLIFPDRQMPFWYLQVSEANTTTGTSSYLKSFVPRKQVLVSPKQPEAKPDAFIPIYKEALMVLINSALERRDREQFMVLSEKWRKIL